MLYHQRNPAQLIHELAGVTDCVLVWAQVADDVAPEGAEASVRVGRHSYRGRMHDYRGARDSDRGFCGGLYGDAIWLYPEALFAAFRDAGFEFVVRHPDRPTVHGAAVLFAASKRDELRTPDWTIEA